MSGFKELRDQDQRYLILLSLVHMGYDGNANMLKTALDAYGHRISSSDLEMHLQWLKTFDLVELNKISFITTVKLTQKGQDVAEGRETVYGVRRPKAGEL
ncbi:hypothetical protein DC081_09045 [Ignatzschineria cameli]|uniref:VpaChn25_0724 family phage protein n=1 Tax=Ignatzschineria cameli TaxID=2182793 RepID=UPI000D603F6F|nr:hypothetical protein [Ignatzschineria cameli]PWD89586.1 hypothetical protein DC081_09045 [Ignatzschineria cameli]